MRTKLAIIGTFLYLICFSFPSGSIAQQSKAKMEKRSKNAEKRRHQLAAEDEKFAEYSREMHQSNQSKDVQKRMKRNRRKARRHNKNKREFFLVRFYKNKIKR